MREKLNCPNCGAPITETICQYCGAVFYDFAAFELGKPTYVRVKHDGTYGIFRAILTDITLEARTTNMFYSDNNIVSTIQDKTLDMSMQLIPDDRGIYLHQKRIEQGKKE